MGKSQKGREELVIEATSRTALRKGDWAMIPPYKGPAINKDVNIALGNFREYQLFNLADDKKEQKNLAGEYPKKLEEMKKTFEKIRGNDFNNVEQLELK